MARARSAFGRLLAALLIVVFPAITATMPLLTSASGHAGVTHVEHAQHGGGSGPHQHSNQHQQCCDLCGAACGGCVGTL